jgi:nucleotide-binding universal stress UspA family protein
MRPLLLCYDGSDDARSAMVTAARVLPGHEAIVLHVSASRIDWGIAPALGPMLAMQDVDDALIEQGRELLEEGLACAREAGFQATGEFRTTGGAVWRTIVDVADEADVAGIVAGSHGLRLRDRLPLGSVAHGLVTHARRPVLITHAGDEIPDGDHDIRRVLLAYDGSPVADAAIDAIPGLLGTEVDVDVAVVWRRAEDLDNGLRARARDLSEHGAERVRELGCQAVPLSAATTSGTGDMLLQLAREIQADVIVMGTHGYGFATRALLGSTAHFLVQRSTLPILVVPPPVGVVGSADAPVEQHASAPA